MTSKIPDQDQHANGTKPDEVEAPSEDKLNAVEDSCTQPEIDLSDSGVFKTFEERLDLTPKSDEKDGADMRASAEGNSVASASTSQSSESQSSAVHSGVNGSRSSDSHPQPTMVDPPTNQEIKTVWIDPEEDHNLASSPTLMPDSDGQGEAASPFGKFGEYELLDVLGRGGMGLVYKARQPRLDRIVALKMVIQGQLDSEADVQRFKSEAEAVAKLDHPGIVPIYEVGEHEGRHYFSMAYVEGKSLANVIANSPMAPRDAAKILSKVADAIHHAHERGILHRDLKPSNVLLDSARQPRVIDFGLAKRFEEDANLTATGMVVGTPSYMAPERIDERLGEVGPASDVYSLGAVLYEMLSARPPFHASSPVDTMEQVLKSSPVPLSKLNSQIPKELDAICLHCLQKNPKQRYASAKELADDLRRWLEHEEVAAPLVPDGSTRPRKSAVSLIFGMTTVAALGGCTWLGWVVQTKQHQIAALSQSLESSNSELASTKETLAGMATQVETAESELHVAQSQLKDVSAQLSIISTAKAESDERVEQLVKAHDELTAQLKTKEQQLRELEKAQAVHQPEPAKSLDDLWRIRNPRSAALRWVKVPGGVEADKLTARGIAELKAGDTQKALETLSNAVKAAPDYIPAYYFRGYLYFSTDDYDLAIADLSKVLQEVPQDVPTLLLRGRAYMRRQRSELAKADISKAHQLQPSNADVLLEMARYLSNLGATHEAETFFQSALKRDPDFSIARFEFARHLLSRSATADFSQALQQATEACKLVNDNEPHYLWLLAVAQSKTGAFDQAVASLRKAISLLQDPTMKNWCQQYIEPLQNQKVIEFPSQITLD